MDSFKIRCQGCGTVLMEAQATAPESNLNPDAKGRRESFDRAWRAQPSTLLSCTECEVVHVYRGRGTEPDRALAVEALTYDLSTLPGSVDEVNAVVRQLWTPKTTPFVPAPVVTS